MRGKEIRTITCTVLTISVLVMSVLLPASTTMADSAVGTKWIESDILGNVNADSIINYKDDFNSAVSKEWLSTTQIPEGYNSYGAFYEADEIMRSRKLSLINDSSQTSHDYELVSTLFSLAGDWQSRNDLGVKPAMKYIDAINSIESLSDLTTFISDETLNPLEENLFSIGTTQSMDDATRYTVMIDEPSYFLNYPDDYTEMSQTGALYYDYYDQLCTYMLQRFGYSSKESSTIFDNAIKFEGIMAPYLYTSDQLSSADHTNSIHNTWTINDIVAKENSFPLSEIITNLGYGSSPDYLVTNPDYISNLGNIYTQQNLTLIKDYFLAHTAAALASFLDREAYEKRLTISNDVFGGEGFKSNEEYCYNVVNNYLSMPLDNLYVNKYCTQKMKEKVTECGEEIIEYYREMLQNEDWLSEETRTYAIQKLDKMTIHAVIPEKRCDYSALTLVNKDNGGTILDAIIQITNFGKNRGKTHIGANVDYGEWNMPTSAVNAFYLPSENAVYFLAGQLVPPLLDDENNYEEFLALVGSTFGHEISHAFDSNGAQYDANGNVVNWWTDADYDAFMARNQKVVDYLSSITPFEDNPSFHINGELIKTEYVADLVAFKPLLAIANKHPGFNYDLFFQAYSVQWRQLSSKESEIMAAESDPHPLNYLRVNAVLQQYQEFYDTYDINPGDGMYLAPEDRLEVW